MLRPEELKPTAPPSPPESDPGSERDDADRVAYFQALAEGFRRAEAAVGPILRYYAVGPHTVCLRFAGGALISQLTPALAHLETEPSAAPDLTISLWDSVSTATRMPLLVESLIDLLRLRWWEQLDGRREIRAYSSSRIRTTFHLGPDILSALDTQENRAVYWVPDAAQIPYYERGYPLQTILNWWAQSRGLYFVHAAAIGTSSSGALLAGQGGSGKSTTTIACALARLGVAGDDYALATIDPVPHGYSLYNTLKLRTRDDLDKFPGLISRVSNGDRLEDEKPMIFLHQHAPDAVLRDFRIRAVLVPQVMADQPQTRARTTTPMVALRALAPSTILQLPGTGQSALRAMSRLVTQVPCYTLELGTDLRDSPRVIAGVIGDVP